MNSTRKEVFFVVFFKKREDFSIFEVFSIFWILLRDLNGAL